MDTKQLAFHYASKGFEVSAAETRLAAKNLAEYKKQARLGLALARNAETRTEKAGCLTSAGACIWLAIGIVRYSV